MPRKSPQIFVTSIAALSPHTGAQINFFYGLLPAPFPTPVSPSSVRTAPLESADSDGTLDTAATTHSLTPTHAAKELTHTREELKAGWAGAAL